MNREYFLTKQLEYRKLLIDNFKERARKLLKHSGEHYVIDLEFTKDYNYDNNNFPKVTCVGEFEGEIKVGVHNYKGNMYTSSISLEELPTSTLEYLAYEKIIGYDNINYNYIKYYEDQE